MAKLLTLRGLRPRPGGSPLFSFARVSAKDRSIHSDSVKTWVILDLVAIGVLLVGWAVSRVRNKRKRARVPAGPPVAPPTTPVAGASTAAPATESPAATGAATGQGAGADHSGSVERSNDDDTDRGEGARVVDDHSGVAPGLQVVVDVAHGRGAQVLAMLRPVLGLPEPSGESEPADDADAATDSSSTGAGEMDTPGAEVELSSTTDVSGPLGADRLVFHTDDAPTLLTNVLSGLRSCGYAIEMVVHHEVILHDVEAGVARICLSHTGDGADAIGGGLPPTPVADAPMIV